MATTPPATRFDPVSYNRTARTLHWIMAALMIVNLCLGLFNESLPHDWKVIPVHKSIGMTILMLVLVRIAWRLTHKPPPLPADMPAWERITARATHVTLYGLMLLQPLSGWIMSSAEKGAITWFFLFDFPKLAVARHGTPAEIADAAHLLLGYLTAALVLLHIAAALRHHFVLKDAILKRMLGSA